MNSKNKEDENSSEDMDANEEMEYDNYVNTQSLVSGIIESLPMPIIPSIHIEMPEYLLPENFLDAINEIAKNVMPDYVLLMGSVPLISDILTKSTFETIESAMVHQQYLLLDALSSTRKSIIFNLDQGFLPEDSAIFTSNNLSILFSNVSEAQMTTILDNDWLPLSDVDYPSDLSALNIDEFMEEAILKYLNFYEYTKNQYLQEIISSYKNKSYTAVSLLAYSTIELIYNHKTQETQQKEGFRRFNRNRINNGKGFNKGHIENFFINIDFDVENSTVQNFIRIINRYFNSQDVKAARNHLGHGGIAFESFMTETVNSEFFNVDYSIVSKNDANRILCLMFFINEII